MFVIYSIIAILVILNLYFLIEIYRIKRGVVKLVDMVLVVLERDKLLYNELMSKYNKDKRIKDLMDKYKNG